jgi:hypothetical protein
MHGPTWGQRTEFYGRTASVPLGLH